MHSYIRSLFDVPLLRDQIVSDVKHHGFELQNGNRIELLAGDYRKVRGFSLLCAILDEACFFGIDDENTKVRSDLEIVRALQPSLATTGGKLIAISSPYAKRGWVYSQVQKHYGKDSSNTLVWVAPSRTMNKTLSQKIIDRAMAEDRAAAMSEYYATFRDDISAYISRELVESLVVKGRIENMPEPGIQYSAFVDISGGRHDGSALSIAHKEDRKIVLDLARCWRSPLHNPYAVIAEMCEILRQWGISRVGGDNYSAEFCSSAFQSHGISYQRSEKPASALYTELLPIMCSAEIELLDNPQLVKELSNLERRTRSGGRDLITHSVNCHDDMANSLAGCVVGCNKRRARAGGLF